MSRLARKLIILLTEFEVKIRIMKEEVISPNWVKLKKNFKHKC